MAKIENLQKLFDFFLIVSKLKQTYRFSEVKDMHHDSTADHSWRLAFMAFMIANELKLDIDVLRTMKIAIVHDLAELVTGDIDVRLIIDRKKTVEEKDKGEIDAMKKITEDLPEEHKKEINDLWYEYLDSKTREAKYLRALNRMEAYLQCIEAGSQSLDHPDLFANGCDDYVKDFPELKDFHKLFKDKFRVMFREAGFPWKKEYGDYP